MTWTWMNRILVALVVVNLALLPLSTLQLDSFGPAAAAAQDPGPCDPGYEGEDPCEPGDGEHFVNCCKYLDATLDGYCCIQCCDWVDYEPWASCSNDGNCAADSECQEWDAAGNCVDDD
jgi:hypothetical protein